MKKILVVTKNWLGDILFQIPAVELIRRQFPQAEIVCAAPSRCREILEAHPAVQRVLVFDEKKEHRSVFAKIGFIAALKKESWDRAYLFHRSRTRAFLMWAGGARERIGFAGNREWFLTHPIPEPRGVLHQVDYFLKLLEGTGASLSPHAVYHFYFSKQDEGAADRVLAERQCRRFVCFHLGANWEPKRWPAEHFAKLADLIEERWGLPVFLTGGPADTVLAGKTKSLVKKARIFSVAGETTLGQLGALFKRSCFVVSGDSGPLHIASGVGAPVVALFGPTDPGLTGPRGPGKKIILSHVPEGYSAPWFGKNFPKDGWLSVITPEQVMDAVEKERWAEPERARSVL